MPGTLGELGQSHIDVVIDSAPNEAFQAAMWRIEARLEVMRYDGVETEEGDPDFAFESINGVPGHAGFGLEIAVLDENGRAALMKIFREELAYVGVKRATISSAVTKGFE